MFDDETRTRLAEFKEQMAGLERDMGLFGTLLVACPNCDDPAVDVPTALLDGLYSGVTVDCPKCGGAIVFCVLTLAQWAGLLRVSEEQLILDDRRDPDREPRPDPELLQPRSLDDTVTALDILSADTPTMGDRGETVSEDS